MLNYIVEVIESLLTSGIFVGLVLAFTWAQWQRRGRGIVVGGLLLGCALAIVMAVMKNVTNMVDTGLWNMRFFVAFLLALIVFGIMAIPPLSKKLGNKAHVVMQVMLAIMLFCRMMYVLPDIYAAPANFDVGDAGILSTDFLFRLIGWAIGLIVIAVMILALVKAFRSLDVKAIAGPMAVTMIVIALVQSMTAVQTMLARRIIASNTTLFNIAKVFTNQSLVFDGIIMAMGVLAVIFMIVASIRANEPYSNNAQRRKIKAKWRNRRRWCAVASVCIIFGLFTFTVLDYFNNQEVELSPSEECEIGEDALYVSLDQVDDGNLHRFTYTTENGVGIRFIVIQKPNSSAYGVGLDACDICGETGYYQRDDEVVCKLCDVVMNINTIGFEGGCNPIPFDYTIEDGYIVVPFDSLTPYESEFE